jgi:hypothetical protein
VAEPVLPEARLQRRRPGARGDDDVEQQVLDDVQRHAAVRRRPRQQGRSAGVGGRVRRQRRRRAVAPPALGLAGRAQRARAGHHALRDRPRRVLGAVQGALGDGGAAADRLPARRLRRVRVALWHAFHRRGGVWRHGAPAHDDRPALLHQQRRRGGGGRRQRPVRHVQGGRARQPVVVGRHEVVRQQLDLRNHAARRQLRAPDGQRLGQRGRSRPSWRRRRSASSCTRFTSSSRTPPRPPT